MVRPGGMLGIATEPLSTVLLLLWALVTEFTLFTISVSDGSFRFSKIFFELDLEERDSVEGFL